MKVLTATSIQGQRSNDFNYCIEGELVCPNTFNICARDEADPDGGCGCGRAFFGLNSHRGTTTAIVADIGGLDRDDVAEAVRSSLAHGGWWWIDTDDVVDHMLSEAERWPTDTIIECRLGEVEIR